MSIARKMMLSLLPACLEQSALPHVFAAPVVLMSRVVQARGGVKSGHSRSRRREREDQRQGLVHSGPGRRARLCHLTLLGNATLAEPRRWTFAAQRRR